MHVRYCTEYNLPFCSTYWLLSLPPQTGGRVRVELTLVDTLRCAVQYRGQSAPEHGDLDVSKRQVSSAARCVDCVITYPATHPPRAWEYSLCTCRKHTKAGGDVWWRLTFQRNCRWSFACACHEALEAPPSSHPRRGPVIRERVSLGYKTGKKKN